MKKLILVPLFVSSLAMAQEPDSSSAIFQLREAERSFAKTSVMYGKQAAFARFLKTESFLFTDHWISNGREVWEGRKPSPSILKWEPELMMISASHDFGISTGPWESQEYRPGTAPLGTGYFLSVWEKENGQWKVALDAGINTPNRTVDLRKFRFFPAGTGKNKKSEVPDYQLLISIDNQYYINWKEQPEPSGYMKNHSANAFVLFNGHLPSESRDTITKWVSSLGKQLSWKPFTGGIASSGDLGFTCGTLKNEVNGKSGSYVRIWRKAGESWEIVIEMLTP